MTTKPHPDSAKYYKPLNKSDRYPLELKAATIFKSKKELLQALMYWSDEGKTNREAVENIEVLHINLWSEDGKFCWAIASINCSEDGYPELRFIGDRPLNERVNWEHFKELTEQAYKILTDINTERLRIENGVFQ